MNSLELAQKISTIASDSKAIDIKILDLKGITSVADFFVICSGSSDRQIKSIADRVTETLKKENVRPISTEGYEIGQWVLVDYADVLLHVFSEEARVHYDLEGFWKNAKGLKASQAPKKSKKTLPSRSKVPSKTKKKVTSPSSRKTVKKKSEIKTVSRRKTQKSSR